MDAFDVVVIGAGAAGLAVAAELGHHGLEPCSSSGGPSRRPIHARR